MILGKGGIPGIEIRVMPLLAVKRLGKPVPQVRRGKGDRFGSQEAREHKGTFGRELCPAGNQQGLSCRLPQVDDWIPYQIDECLERPASRPLCRHRVVRHCHGFDPS